MKTSRSPGDQIRILFLSDTHLGFDYPLRPKIKKRRRGPDFFCNYLSALTPALDGDVDFVVHGGDLFFRRKVHPIIVEKAFSPLWDIADSGIPVLLVPGNHERGNIPVSLFESHPNIFIFQKPATYTFQINNKKIGFSGFPYYYNGIRDDINLVIEKTGFSKQKCDVHFLCVHHLFSGAFVGVQKFVFKNGKDIIGPHKIPANIDLVLSGHIHTTQKMIRDFNNNRLPVPILYAGSTERTSLAERNEEKGYYLINVNFDSKVKEVKTIFKKITSRPMVQIELFVEKIKTTSELEKAILFQLECLEKDSVVQIKINGEPAENIQPLLKDSYLREIAPDTMNISFKRKRGIII
jgi:DNA repair protein SbcD/Mre11